MASLGELRIDLIANIAKFVSPFNTATNRVERFARQVSGSLGRVERSLQKTGTQLSIKVTAPLAALSVAAVKAADKNGDFADSLERLGLQARAALGPLGKSLMQAFESIRPQVEDAIKLVNGLAQAFSELDPATRESIIAVAAYAAAVGPALLASSAFFTVMKTGVATLATASSAIGDMLAPLASLRAVTLANVKAALLLNGALAALAGFEFGRYLFDEFQVVQHAAAGVIAWFQKRWADVKFAFLAGVEVVKAAVFQTLDVLKAALGKFFDDFGKGISYVESLLPSAGSSIGAALQASAQAMLADAKQALAGTSDAIAELADAREKAYADAQAVLATTLQESDREFAGKDRKGRSFLDFVSDDLARLRELVDENVPGIKSLGDVLERARQIAAGIRLPEVVTRRDQKAIEEAARNLERMKAAAQAIIERNDPRVGLRRELGEARALNVAGVLPDEEFLKEAARIKKALDELGDKGEETFAKRLGDAISGFSVRVSDTFADLVVDGKASFSELAKSFAKMIISMTVQEKIFKQLFDAIGQGVTQLLTGPATPNPSPTPSVPQASGGLWLHGRKLAFAAGGVIGSPTLFPMVGGVGLMGEKGPEAIMPLTRINGQLGVRAAGGSTIVQVIDQRKGGAPVEVSERRGPGGSRLVQMAIRDELKAAFADGSMDKLMGSSYGLSRKGARR